MRFTRGFLNSIKLGKKVCPLFLFLFIISQPAYAQGSDDERRSWLSAGIFFLGGETPFFASQAEAANAAFHYQYKAHLFSVRTLWIGTLFNELTESWDLGILYGRATVSEYFHASVSGGPAVTGGHRLDDFALVTNSAPTIGVALQAQVFLHFTGTFGAGFYGFANLNSENQLYGVTLNLQFGGLRGLSP